LNERADRDGGGMRARGRVCGLFLIYLHFNPLGSSCNPCRQKKIRESDWLFFPIHRRESDFSSTASFSGHCTNCSWVWRVSKRPN